MRRAVIVLFAAFFVALPALSHAQYNDTDRQNPKEYNDEDSQPVAIIADALYPIGFAAEWLVARPLHWVANDSPAAPLYRPVGAGDKSAAPLVPIIPDNTMDQASTSTTPQDWSPTRAPITTNTAVVKPIAPLPPLSAPPAASSQPALH
jgi:hypothetical protein